MEHFLKVFKTLYISMDTLYFHCIIASTGPKSDFFPIRSFTRTFIIVAAGNGWLCIVTCTHATPTYIHVCMPHLPTYMCVCTANKVLGGLTVWMIEKKCGKWIESIENLNKEIETFCIPWWIVDEERGPICWEMSYHLFDKLQDKQLDE